MVAFAPEYNPEAVRPTTMPLITMTKGVPPKRAAAPIPNAIEIKGAHLLGTPRPFTIETTPKMIGEAANKVGLISIISIVSSLAVNEYIILPSNQGWLWIIRSRVY